jgi:nucleoside-diphosphate-sugar epimerase
MRIWVTGARGFIGRHVVEQAALGGHEVCAIVRPGASPAVGQAGPARPLAVALDDPGSVQRAIDDTAPDAIIHLAWYAHPQDYLESDSNLDSLVATLAFARAALSSGCRRMVGAGTCLEYADLPRSRVESDPLDPRSLYARCKHAAHLVLGEVFERRGAALIWARLFHIHGPGEHPARLVPALAAALREGRSFALSPGQQLRDHLDVRDVASALVHLAGSGSPGPVNVCSGRPLTLQAVMETVAREVGSAAPLQFGQRPYREGEIMNLTGVPERLMGSGWRPAHVDLAKSIRETIAAGDVTS